MSVIPLLNDESSVLATIFTIPISATLPLIDHRYENTGRFRVSLFFGIKSHLISQTMAFAALGNQIQHPETGSFAALIN